MILSSTVLCEFQPGRLLLCAIKGLLSTSNGHLPNMTCFAGELAERYLQDVRKNDKVNISLHRPKVTKTTCQNHQNTQNSWVVRVLANHPVFFLDRFIETHGDLGIPHLNLFTHHLRDFSASHLDGFKARHLREVSHLDLSICALREPKISMIHRAPQDS